MSENKTYISSSPHFRIPLSTRMIMATVLIALLPEIIYGTILFGFRALAVVLVSVAACTGFEALFQLITKQKIVVSNLSAAVTGVMLALVCPPSVPFWQLIIGDLVAVVIAKGLFGGIGSNVFNPALTGRAVMFLSFPADMGASWPVPGKVSDIDAVSSSTVLSGIKSGTTLTQDLNLKDLFFGHQAGCIGETSVLLLIISFIILLAMRVIDFRASISMLVTVALTTFIASLAGGKEISICLTDTAVALCTGGVMFGAVFMVTDYATTPVTKGGRLVFGAGCGLITFLIRKFGGYPEGVMFSILIMNTVAPFLNNITYRKYGYGKKASVPAQEGIK